MPATVFSILEEAGKIPDPYVRFGTDELTFVGGEDYTYSVVGAATFPPGSKVTLVAEGLIVFSKVFVNGKQVGQTDNQFVTYEFDVTNQISGAFEIKIVFDSIIKAGEELTRNVPYPLPYILTPGAPNGRNLMRIKASQYGWDWGPSFPDMGIWKQIYLRVDPPSTLFINELLPQITPHDSENLWYVDIKSSILSNGVQKDDQLQITLTTTTDTTPIVQVTVPITIKPNQNEYQHTLQVPYDKVKKWYPVGYGSADLYNIHLSVQSAKPLTKRIAFRKVEIIQDSLPKKHENQISRSFYFKVNDIPIYAKGANFIPTESFEKKNTDERIRQVLRNALLANHNMVRVWGGGIYQSDSFYDYCDENGLLVWQEFMFACAIYPSDPNFLQTVEREVISQVKRLMHHPSIVIWGGNNENEVSMSGNSWYSKVLTVDTKARYYIDYNKLYIDTIRKALLNIDSTRLYWHSSPSNGALVDQKDYFVGIWDSPGMWEAGDLHYYDSYDFDCTDVSRFPRGRFISEYGFQSFPDRTTFATSKLNPEEYQYDSKLLWSRQHANGVTTGMINQLKLQFKVDDTRTLRDFDHFVYLTQVQQGMCIKAQSEYYRTMKNQDSMTMGSLYWQLNDIWPAPSWASVDYKNKWKALHFESKRFYEKVHVSSYINLEKKYVVYVTSDEVQPVSNAKISVSAWKYDSKAVHHVVEKNFDLKPLDNVLLFNSSQIESDFLKGSPLNECLLQLVVSINGKVVSENVFLPSKLKDVNLMMPNTKMVASKVEGGFLVKVESDVVAPFVFVDFDEKVEGLFDDNSFLLVPGVTKQMSFECHNDACKDMSAEEFTSHLIVRHIRATY